MAMLATPRSENVYAIELAVKVLESRWKCIILYHLLERPARFGELRRRVPDLTQKTLTHHLRSLESSGLIERRVYAEVPVKVEYTMSPLGRTIEPVLLALRHWGETLENAGAAAMPRLVANAEFWPA